ncbi:MAG: FliM/FliN family flagellar motor switch protein [Myxococcota bacterium]
MSAESPHVLSRDELAALLDALRDRQRGAARASVFRPLPARERDERPRFPLVRRALEQFAAAYAKQMSSRFQRTIGFELIGWQSVAMGEWLDAMEPDDAAIAFDDERSGGRGYVLLNRPLAYAWLTMAFGARPHAPVTIPERPYTRIERNFLRRRAEEILRDLAKEMRDVLVLSPKVGLVEGPSTLVDRRAERISLVSFDVEGLAGPSRLRIGLPPAAVESTRPELAEHAAPPSRRADVKDVPVRVRAELGRSELSLGRLGALRVGDWLPLEGRADGAVTLRVEGTAKFAAVAGRRGSRLAARITDRLG